MAEDGEEPEAPEPIVYRDLSPVELQAAVEATFFMHHKPITVAKLRELINPSIAEDDYRTAVSNLMASYFDEGRGVELIEVAGGFQFRTKAEHKDIVRRMYQIAPMKLTNAMLEVLAIVAYNQPLTREGVDKIRGVDSSHLLRMLLDKKMLRIAGKSDDIGRPMIYATTKEFLELFGLRDLSALPSLRELEEMLPKNEVGSISEEEALASEMDGIATASKPLEFNDLELEEWDDEVDAAGEPSEPKGPKLTKEERQANFVKRFGRKSEANENNTAAMAEESTADEKAAVNTDETQKIPENDLTPSENSDSGTPLDSSSESRNEAGDDFDLPPEIARRITPGQEGNA
jgi:segregation and condensation protein B